MKKIILLFSVVSIFAACKNSNPYNKNMVLVDTTGLYKSNAMTDAAKAQNSSSTRTWGTSEARATTHAVYPNNNNTTPTSGTTTTTTTTTTPAVPQKDKGWSSAAKGTAIGAGTGAVVGAIATKSAKGAIIGGILGGGAGYAIGRSKDRKSGRVARARARKAAGY